MITTVAKKIKQLSMNTITKKNYGHSKYIAKVT